jgi:pilus assembly protein CpaB
MSKTKSVVLAVVLGLLAFLLFRVKVGSVKKELLAEYGEETSVVVAARDILPGVEIEKDDIGVERVPAVFAQPGVFDSADEVIGRMAQIPIRSGEQIIQTKLVFAEGGYLSLKIGKDPARRAITLKFDGEGGMVGLLHPGDSVDVFGVFESAGSAGGVSAKNHAMVLVQGVEVLAMDRRLSEGPIAPQENGKKGFTMSSGSAGNIRNTWFVTLDVLADEAWRLSLASQIAHLRCVLRQRTNREPHDYAPVGEAGPSLKSDEVFDAGGKTIYPSGQPKPPFAE